MMAVRYADCTRRWHRNREASETRCAQTADASFSDFGTSDVSPSTGTPTATATAEPTATATVAARNVKDNRNGRCAGNGINRCPPDYPTCSAAASSADKAWVRCNP